ncbi:MAG: nuclear transport factor 2 family protein [Treponema sp.]|uniref:nuclear transport factor 2 family protein n=1 Tax=Treponema sp. TaxID=166 RepID=UPI0025D24B09|nr:nuclear transport factor 2 family protein [Treponema sp.]MBR0496793.1 nuclear transport factor 2 family protein [Treponema sp.]
MKKLTTIFAMLVLVLTACTGQESKQRNGTSPMTTEEKEVYSAYEAINKAMIEKDQTALELYFDEKLTFTHMSGKKQTREEFIGEIMDGTLNYFKVDTKDYSISVNGDTARMKVTHTLTAKVYGISGSWTMGGENTYKKRDGIWIRVE